MAINLSPEMNSELRKAVTSFNRKIKRLEAKGVTASLLPEKVNVRDLKRAYKDSESLNRKIRQLANFTSKGATITTKKGIVGTEAMFNYREQQKQEMIRIYKQQKNVIRANPIRYKGRTTSYLNNLTAKIKYLEKSSRRRDARALLNESRNMLTPEALVKKNSTFRANYYRTLDEFAAISPDAKRSTINSIKRKLDEIEDIDFYRVIQNNPEFDKIYNYMNYQSDDEELKSRPKYTEEEVLDNLKDLDNSIEGIIANSL